MHILQKRKMKLERFVFIPNLLQIGLKLQVMEAIKQILCLHLQPKYVRYRGEIAVIADSNEKQDPTGFWVSNRKLHLTRF